MPVTTTRTTEHSFTVHIDGIDIEDEALFDSLHEAGCDDALFSLVNGETTACFARRAPSFSDALLSALADLRAGAPAIRITRIEPDDLVSLSDVAVRVGRSRESIRLYVRGLRGPGGFPRPEIDGGRRVRYWNWPEVVDWFHRHEILEVGEAPGRETASLIAALNAAFTLRDRRAEIDSPEQAAMLDEVLDALGVLAAAPVAPTSAAAPLSAVRRASS